MGQGIIGELYGLQRTRDNQPFLTIGTVIDTNDPQEMGRLRILCPTLNDPDLEDLLDSDLENIPWATAMTPFGGHAINMKRGPEEKQSLGPLAYGLWAIPTVGTQVIVACIDGDAQLRVWIGCLHSQLLPHTMPHGRFFGTPKSIDGPGTSTEQPIATLRANQKEAFGESYEFISRAADYTVAAIPNEYLSTTVSSRIDDKNKSITLPNGTVIEYNQGYASNRDPDSPSAKESQVVALTSPGFHSLSMDDRAENCRIRIRTTTGHQIILDDTNERIVINTNEGRSFIEMDATGNIDIHAERQLSFHSSKDMSFTTDGKMRFRAFDGIHFVSDKDIRMSAKADVNIRTAANLRINTDASAFIESNSAVHIKSQTALNLETMGINIKAASNLNIQAGANLNLSAGASILETASVIHLNGPVASPAGAATSADSVQAYSTIRVPFRKNGNNQPWSRGMLNPQKTDNDSSFNGIDYYDYSNFEFGYESTEANKVELGESLNRNPKWRR